MENVMFFSVFDLVPNDNNGKEIIKEFSEEPGIPKKVEFSNGEIIVSRICPYGHHQPRKFSALDYHISGTVCSPPSGHK